MLRAAVVRQQSAQLESRRFVDELRELDRVLTRRNAGARADGDVDHDIGDHAGRPRRVVQLTRVLIVVDGLDETRVALLQLHRAANLGGRQVRRRHQDAIDALRKERLRFAQLGGADADGAGGHLHLRNRRALVRLGVRPHRDLVRVAGPLHFGDVALQLVEIDTERRRVEIPFRDAGFLRDDGDDLLGRVALDGLRDPHMRGRGCGRADKRASAGAHGVSISPQRRRGAELFRKRRSLIRRVHRCLAAPGARYARVSAVRERSESQAKAATLSLATGSITLTLRRRPWPPGAAEGLRGQSP